MQFSCYQKNDGKFYYIDKNSNNIEILLNDKIIKLDPLKMVTIR